MRFGTWTGALAVVLTAASPAIAAEQFNLNCTGSLQTIAPSIRKDATEPYTTVYRLDLDARKWCEGDCKIQHDFASISPVDLVLQDKNVDTPREHNVIHNRISRETGAQSAMAEGGVGEGRVALFWRGQCEKAPFTSFPSVATKF